MERKLASIQRIKALDPIGGADRIERATVLGWHLVVNKGEFAVGDKCVYVEVDSILPEKPEFEFLRPRGFRIKTIRLRKQISQGIAFPLKILESNLAYKVSLEPKPMLSHLSGPSIALDEGTEVTEFLEIKKYVPYVPAQLAGEVKGAFPGFIPKTDETRIQSVPDVLTRQDGNTFVVTEKLDGCSMTVYLRDGEFGVCSRNLDLKETENNSLWKVARELDLENKLKILGWNVAIQGELVGQGIQKNKYKKTNLELYVFNVFNIDTYTYLNHNEAHKLVEFFGLKTVPVIGEAKLTGMTVDDLVKIAEGEIKLNAGENGRSKLNQETMREGVIFRPYFEEQDPDVGRLSFKVINPRFLLKFDD